jgi:FtsH-binding integral membrane protein
MITLGLALLLIAGGCALAMLLGWILGALAAVLASIGVGLLLIGLVLLVIDRFRFKPEK